MGRWERTFETMDQTDPDYSSLESREQQPTVVPVHELPKQRKQKNRKRKRNITSPQGEDETDETNFSPRKWDDYPTGARRVVQLPDELIQVPELIDTLRRPRNGPSK